MITKSKIKIAFLILICFMSFTIFIITKITLSYNDLVNITMEEKYLLNIKTANSDTSPPAISFIKPDINDTKITGNFYDIIVNVSDENPPLPGNVLIEISNATASLFNASMTYDEGAEWFFTWNNITYYKNEITYYFQVRAKDSSSNENFGISEVLSVYVGIYFSRNPSFLNGIIYIILVSLLIAGVMVYLNKRRNLFSSSRK
ncbi:MAG: hypothetical protein ACFE8B_09850 [Candidatus Hermodarchaeota archaeon]